MSTEPPEQKPKVTIWISMTHFAPMPTAVVATLPSRATMAVSIRLPQEVSIFCRAMGMASASICR